MKKTKANTLWTQRAAWGTVLLLMGLLLSACGPPGTTQAGVVDGGDGNGGGTGPGELEVLPPLPADCLSVDSAGTITSFYRTQAGCDLTEFEIPRAKGSTIITAIGALVFRGDGTSRKLTKITIPDSVKTIEHSAFFANDLSSVSIPDGVETIGSSAFRGNMLTSIVIPNSVTTIEGAAFLDNQLTSLTLSNKLINIALDAFRNNQLSSINIPSSVRTIQENAFLGNRLASISIPDSVETIEAGAFDFNALTSVSIPNSVTTIQRNVFYNNPDLVTIAIDPNPGLSLDSGAFPNNFFGAFDPNRTQAGTWTWAGGAWTFAP